MAKIQRVTGKVFGGTATATGNDPQIGQFGSALANTYVGTTDISTIQQLPAWGQGFIGAVTPENQFPALPEMTGFGKVLSQQQCYILQQGVPEWDNGTTYYTGNFCAKNSGLYVSLTDENLGNNPLTDNINWQEYSTDGWNVNIANCIKEIPQRIKVELDNGIITLKAGSVVYVPNGFETDGVTPKFDEITINSDLSTGPNAGTDGTVVYLFYQTDGILRYFNTSSNTSSGTTAPTGNYKCWYDITNNLIKHTNGSGVWETTYQSLPICLCQSSSEYVYASIATIFNGLGRMALELWVDKGVKGLIPNGRNEDGTLKNIEFTTNRVMTNRVYGSQTRVIAIDADHFQLPLLSDYRYDQETNYNLYQETTQAVECIAGIVETNNNAISRFQTKQPFQALDANTVNAWIVDNYTNGKSGYIIYSNNYCEQWGFISNATSGSHTTITLLKPYASINYSVLATYNTSSTTTAGGTQWAVAKMTTTNFAIGSQGGSYAWRAYGYLP